MAKYTEKQINNIYLRAENAPMEQLLQLCFDPESGITIDGLRAIHYSKIQQLEQRYNAQAEEIVWAKSQGSIEALTQYIEKCKNGTFTKTHLHEAMDKRKELAAVVEEEEWLSVKDSQDMNLLMEYIKKCDDGTYSDTHLLDAKNITELIDWNIAKESNDTMVMNGYIQKCRTGFYPTNHLEEANETLDKWANGTIVAEWNKLSSLKNSDPQKCVLLNIFIQCYKDNLTETAQKYLAKANDLMKVLEDAEAARKDWIDAKQENSILGYVNFLAKHPYCEYREEAEVLIKNMKGNLLSDMKRFPFKYNRELMYDYISTNALTMEDLVDTSNTLTDRAYSHIKRYPRLIDEQRQLPVSRLENPHSEDGNTDIYFFGVSGSGKTCVLAGLMSLTGQLGFRFDPKGPGGGGNYAMELRNYARTSMLPPATDQNYIQVIDGQINDEEGHLHKISLIEMSGEKTADFAAMDNPTSLEDLGVGASGLLSNNNNKVIFFVIDPTNEKQVQMGESNQWVMQSDVLSCVSSLLSKNKALMKNVVAIHVILTKSDTLGDYADQNVIQNVLNEQGYHAVLEDIKSICEQYSINKQTGFHVGLYPFCVGKFMAGDVYTFDETDSLKILRVIQKNSVSRRKKGGFFDSLTEWFNN